MIVALITLGAAAVIALAVEISRDEEDDQDALSPEDSEKEYWDRVW